MRMRVAPLLIAGLLFGVACGDDDDDSVADDSQALCASVAAAAATVEQIAGAQVDPDATTVGDVKSALDTLQSDIEAVHEAEDTLSTELRTSLQSAWNGFTSAVEDISDDSTLAEAGADVETARTQFREAWATTVSQLSCQPPTTT